MALLLKGTKVTHSISPQGRVINRSNMYHNMLKTNGTGVDLVEGSHLVIWNLRNIGGQFETSSAYWVLHVKQGGDALDWLCVIWRTPCRHGH